MKRKKSEVLEWDLMLRLRAGGLPQPEREFRFHPTRKWRFDFAYPAFKIAVEVEGGVWIAGRHSRGKGFISDCEKYNAAAVLGWTVLRYTKELFASAAADVRAVKSLHKL